MKTTPLFVLTLAFLVCRTSAATVSPQTAVESIFPELGALKSMPSGQRYTLPAGGEKLSGVGDDFLRRRTADEIADSGLSCGCGDYALVFIARVEPMGFETRLIDSAQLSLISLAGTNSGHVVVAMRPRGDAKAPWWLVDTTARNVLSRDWSPEAKSFTASGQVYWIGYCGSVADYPVNSPAALKKFYAKTLTTVPPEVFNQTLTRFVFTIDPAMKDERGGYRNPRVERLQTGVDEILAKYRVKPAREVAIRVIPGDDDAQGNLKKIGNEWVARVGLKSACSASYLNYLEQTYRREVQKAQR
jgi:hypothetical protein